MRGKTIKLIYFSLKGSEVKEISIGWQNALLIGIGATAVLGLLITGVLAVFTDFYKDMRIRNLENSNTALEQQLDDMGATINNIQAAISELEQKDDDMRIFVKLDELPDDIREVGTGGGDPSANPVATSSGGDQNTGNPWSTTGGRKSQNPFATGS